MYDWVIYRREVTRTRLRDLAKEIGIPKTSLEEFANKHTSSPRRIWPQLRDWFIVDRHRKVDDKSRPEEIILSVLHTLRTIPHHRRPEAMQEVAKQYRALHKEMGIPVPTWVEMLEGIAEREKSNPAGSEADMIIPLPETKKGDDPAPEP